MVQRYRFNRSVIVASLLLVALALTGATSSLRAQPSEAQNQVIVSLPLITRDAQVAAPGPVITAFFADPPAIAPGGSATLRWQVSGATALRIEPEIGSVGGDSRIVSPAATTTYTLIASNPAGESRASVRVTVEADPSSPVPGFFSEPDKKTGTPDIALDASGAMHMVYRYHVPFAEGADAVYAVCAAPAEQCADPIRWQRVVLGGPVDEVQIELTAGGAPRVLATVVPLDGPSERQFVYGACDRACTDINNWNWANVTFAYGSGVDSITALYLPQRSFALDPAGRPRFVFYNADYRVEPDRYGGYYAACDAACTDPLHWSVTTFTHERVLSEYVAENELINFPALAFTPDGKPRVVAMLYPLNGTGEDGIYYFACDAACEDPANWQRVMVADRGQGPYPIWDIAVDQNGRSHIAFFKAGAEDDSGERLHYLTCGAGCLNRANWEPVNLGLPRGVGDGVDIALDAQGRPRMAHFSGEDLVYSWCDTGCTDPRQWHHAVVDQDEQLEAEYPIARPITCDAGIWDVSSPVLALDSTGHPRIAYEGGYKARCQFQNPDDPNDVRDVFIEIWHSVRTVVLP